MAIDSVIHTNEQSIDRVLQAGLPVVLAFWSKSAPVSVAWTQALEAAAANYAGRLLVAKVDADTEKSIREHFHVHALPAIVVTKQGKPEAMLGPQSQANELHEWLRYLIEGGNRPTTTEPSPAPVSAQANQGNGKPITLTDSNFDQITQGQTPVLVDFWAPWCGPCRMVAPAVEEVAKAFQGRAIIGKLNVDENPRTAQRYQIMGIPALYIFKGGKVVEQMVGVQPVTVLQQRLALHTK